LLLNLFLFILIPGKSHELITFKIWKHLHMVMVKMRPVFQFVKHL
jgi:hypothetical protein